MYYKEDCLRDNNVFSAHTYPAQKEIIIAVEDDDSDHELVELAAEDSSDSDQQQQLDLDNVLEDNLDDIEGVVGQCSALLRRTKEAETTASAVADQDPLDKVELGLDMIRKRLLTCAYYKLTAQEFVVLKSERLLAADPSVQFFGLEWSSVFSRCYKVGMEIRLLKSGLKQNRLCTERLASCLALVNQLTHEIQLHRAAQRSGRLSAFSLAMQQQQQAAAAAIPRTRSFRDPGAKAGKSLRKYRGSKTDSALADPAAVDRTSAAKRSARDVTKSKSRKSSLIGSFSNMFKAGLKL